MFPQISKKKLRHIHFIFSSSFEYQVGTKVLDLLKLMWLEKNDILPNGGLMVIYHDRIRIKSPTKQNKVLIVRVLVRSHGPYEFHELS